VTFVLLYGLTLGNAETKLPKVNQGQWIGRGLYENIGTKETQVLKAVVFVSNDPSIIKIRAVESQPSQTFDLTYIFELNSSGRIDFYQRNNSLSFSSQDDNLNGRIDYTTASLTGSTISLNEADWQKAAGPKHPKGTKYPRKQTNFIFNSESEIVYELCVYQDKLLSHKLVYLYQKNENQIAKKLRILFSKSCAAVIS
jgi:hypothetical protein